MVLVYCSGIWDYVFAFDDSCTNSWPQNIIGSLRPFKVLHPVRDGVTIYFCSLAEVLEVKWLQKETRLFNSPLGVQEHGSGMLVGGLRILHGWQDNAGRSTEGKDNSTQQVVKGSLPPKWNELSHNGPLLLMDPERHIPKHSKLQQ